MIERPPLPSPRKYDPHFYDPWYVKFARSTIINLAIAVGAMIYAAVFSVAACIYAFFVEPMGFFVAFILIGSFLVFLGII